MNRQAKVTPKGNALRAKLICPSRLLPTITQGNVVIMELRKSRLVVKKRS